VSFGFVAGLDAWGSDPIASHEVVEQWLLAAVQPRRCFERVNALWLAPRSDLTRHKGAFERTIV
jgi:hypothetical protein